MIVALVNARASAEKLTEVSQTLTSLSSLIREEDGCLRCELYQDSGDAAAFTIIEEWESRRAFDEHLRSRVFCVLLGLGPLLTKPIDVSICAVASREGMEAVKRARGCAVAH